ncbi:uncharacterized protein L201_007020 [Kwoniella dendrophila CBS 6074]|uniref:Actin interacting protein 3 C-terminal domain-containing protein n=1 Tax=Kwoniella dendrophila CBS 6074 TaxID=1295534 RepID=A0AAX4K2Y9_9TREE
MDPRRQQAPHMNPSSGSGSSSSGGWNNQRQDGLYNGQQASSTVNPRDVYNNHNNNNNPYGVGSSLTRRSRSPESDRSRQSSNNARQPYRPVDTYISEDAEPGQILSPKLGLSSTSPYVPVSIAFSSNNNNNNSNQLPPREPRALASASNHSRQNSAQAQTQMLQHQQQQQATQYRPTIRKVSTDRPNDGGRSPLPGVGTGGGSSSSRDTLTSSSGSVTVALETFTKAMHLALQITSQHALALKHFQRLGTSPHVNQNTPTYEEAERRTNKAQKVLDEQMINLQGSFTELMRRTLGTTGTSAQAINALELDGLKVRIRKMEERSSRNISQNQSQPLPPPPEPTSDLPPSPPPPPPPSDVDGPPRPRTPSIPPPPIADTTTTSNQPVSAEEKKVRIRDIVNDFIERLDKVETFIREFDGRVDDIETTFISMDNIVMEVASRKERLRKFANWDDLEDSRDPSGTIRGLKRKERATDGQDGELEDAEGQHTARPSRRSLLEDEDVDMMSTGTGTVQPVKEDLREEIEKLRDEIKVLKSQIAKPVTTPSTPTQHPPNSPAAALGNMMSQLKAQRQALAFGQSEKDQSDPSHINTNQRYDELKEEVGKLAEQIKSLQTSITIASTNNGSSTSATQSTNGIMVNGETRPDIAKLQNTVNGIQGVLHKLSLDVKTLLNDKEQRLGVFEKISNGVQMLAENIQKCKNDYNNLNELNKASSATILMHTENLKIISTNIQTIHYEIKLIKQSPSFSSSFSDNNTKNQNQKDEEIKQLKQSLNLLQNDLKEMRDNRENWTKDVMTACLDTLKEENERRKEDYAKIARKEIQNTIKDFMAKRSSSTSASAPSASTSMATSNSQINRSISEPVDNSNIAASTSPAIPPTALPGASTTSNPVQSDNLTPLQKLQNLHSPHPSYPAINIYGASNNATGTIQGNVNPQQPPNSLSSRINSTNPAVTTTDPNIPRPTLSDRMSGSSITPATEQQPQALKDRFTGQNLADQNASGSNMDID